jgi:nucleoside-diphosphate-sugar epimerase
MRVLVIGGTRFIGPPAVRSLVALGHDVTVFHRGETESDLPEAVSHMHGERSALVERRAEIRAIRPDVVLDMQCMFERDARSLIAAIDGLTPRVVFVSSADVYRAYGRMHGTEPGPPEPMPIDEDAPVREREYPYRGQRRDGSMDDYDKIPVERALMSHDRFSCTVLRLPAVHGEGDPQRRMMMDIARIDAGRNIILPVSAERWRWSRAYVGNVAGAIARCVVDARAAGRVYHGPVDPPLTQREWVESCGRIAGWQGNVVALPDEAVPGHLRLPINFTQDLVLDDQRLRRELAYTDDFTAEEGMTRAIAWERAQPRNDLNPRLFDYAAEDTAMARHWD